MMRGIDFLNLICDALDIRDMRVTAISIHADCRSGVTIQVNRLADADEGAKLAEALKQCEVKVDEPIIVFAGEHGQ